MANENVTDTAVAVITEDAANAKPKTLRAYEVIVEKNTARGASFWRIAADALLSIKTHKLWKKAKDADGNGYKSFVDYAEARFGFKKTYAYDLVKAATRTPDAITEGAARAEANAARGSAPLLPWEAAGRIGRAFASFEDRAGNLRDRAIDHEEFVEAYDRMVGRLQEQVREFTDRYPQPEPVAEAPEDAKNVSPIRKGAKNAKNVTPTETESESA